nr:MAG TPA: hypothetical protein [Caudoviricetes sp.]
MIGASIRIKKKPGNDARLICYRSRSCSDFADRIVELHFLSAFLIFLFEIFSLMPFWFSLR